MRSNLLTRANLIYGLIEGDTPSSIGKSLVERVTRARLAQYEAGKQVRSFFLYVPLTFTGQVETVTAYTDPVGHDLLFVGATTNIPLTTNVSMNLRDTSVQESVAVTPVHVSAFAGNVQSSIERYRPLPIPRVVPAQAQLVVSVTNNIAALNGTYYLVFECLWVSTEKIISDTGGDKALDAQIKQKIQTSDQRTVMLTMTVPFTGTASERVKSNLLQYSEPLFIWGIGYGKTPLSLTETTFRLIDTSNNYAFSSSEIPLIAGAGYPSIEQRFVELPEPYLLRPNSVIRGEFTNATNGTPESAAGATLNLVCVTP